MAVVDVPVELQRVLFEVRIAVAGQTAGIDAVAVVMQCSKNPHVLMFNVISVEEALISGVHHEHRCDGDYNCCAQASDFTLHGGGGHLYIVPLWSLPS